MKRLTRSWLVRPAAAALLAGLVYVLSLGGTAWAQIGDRPSAAPAQGPRGSVPAREADLALIKSGAWAGNTITFTLRVVNGGRSVARGVMLNDPLPANVTFQSATLVPPRPGNAPEPCALREGVVLCNLGNLPAGREVVVELRVLVPNPRTVEVQNMALVTSQTFDPIPLNNFAELLINRP